MDQRQELLLAQIELAFAGVRLGEGVSLHESNVIDNYGTSEERQIARAPDEKLDWQKLIDDPDLTKHFGIGYSGLCFLDSEGFRFHLPACMFRLVRDFEDGKVGNLLDGLYFRLIDPKGHSDGGHFALLNNDQRICVRDFLIYFRDMDGELDDELDHAIASFGLNL